MIYEEEYNSIPSINRCQKLRLNMSNHFLICFVDIVYPKQNNNAKDILKARKTIGFIDLSMIYLENGNAVPQKIMVIIESR